MNFQTKIKLKYLSDHLCAKSRPVHFTGVATIITKLFNIVMPDAAVFGQKDYQQLQIIRQLTLDLDFDIKIIAGPTFREKDGIAMSSRNAYLTNEQRALALSLFKALNLAKKLIKEKEKDLTIVKNKIETFILSFGEINIEYVCFCDPETLENADNIKKSQVLLALAVKIGKTRLIDNALINLSQ